MDDTTVLLTNFDHRGLKDVAVAFASRRVSALPGSNSIGNTPMSRFLTNEAMARFAPRVDFCISHGGGSLTDVIRSRLPVLRDVPWVDSRDAVDWRRLGVDGDGLSTILSRFGLFADLSVSWHGCEAIVEALSIDRWSFEMDPPLAQMRRRLDERRVEVVATGPTYEIRNDLMIRGYRWIRGTQGVGGYWRLVVSHRDALREVAWIRHRLHAQGGSAEIRELR